ncbi:hypothetical protein TNCT_383491 [Trichonephila clavata]|uniref:Uncharacterized protein n=1 Tax=Trichonephila clavata TaxID=2740835 RepID=A0A8X6GDP8_TRICU|nr:hypothetical protein TNCT_285751 [Trichonephila clavata]GFR01064.1 hypothetical protein TNCT_383491 [Trichonephila clavata]
MNCGLRRIGLVREDCEVSIIDKFFGHFFYFFVGGQEDFNSTIVDILICVILKSKRLLNKKEVILSRVVEESALGPRSLTRTLGGGGMHELLVTERVFL